MKETPTVSIGQFPLKDKSAVNHGSCIHHLGLDMCFDEYNYRHSLQAWLIDGAPHRLDIYLHLHKTPKIVATRYSVFIGHIPSVSLLKEARKGFLC